MAIVRTTHRAARVGHDRARGEWADMAGCTGPADARGGPGGSPALPCLTGLAGRAAAGLLLALAVLAAIMPMRASAQDKDAARAPNIVIVLADDLGYGDVGYLNSQSQIPTPNLDTLAGQGMAFLDAHSPSAVCTPTRYGLLTGRYAWRTRLTRGVLDGYDGPLIAPNRETLGSFLGSTGYRTAVIGKWHLGLGFAKNALGEFDFEEPIDDGPHTHGFHESYIIPASLDFPPYVYIRDGEITGFPLGQQSGMEFPRYMRAGELASDFDPADVLDELIRQATGFIQRQASDGSPFLLYLPLTAPHKPVWPAQRFEGTTELGPYGDFIVQVDAAVGDVMSALDQAGVDDNTLLIVTSDNGSFMSRLDGLDDRDHTDDSTIQAYRAGNHTANHVYRGTKADIWEGGHRVPFFARWPGQIEPGSTREEVISLTDVFATVAEIVGKELPNNAAEDSFSLLPLLRGNPWARPRAAVTHHSIQGMFAIRDGRWKLVAGNGSGGREDPIGQPFERPYQLFDIASDPSEQSNVYDQHPAVAQRLERELERIRSWDRSRMTTAMAALVALYNGTNGANWKTNTNWLSEAPLVSLWDWHGVTTDENGRVTELALASNDLSGTIPAELGERNLTKLQRLDLSENELSGAIPLTLMTLSQLSVLDIRSTTLCAPADTAFQAWLATISFQGVVCADNAGHKVDGVKPALAANGGAVVNGTTLTLTFGERLDGSSTPQASAFTVTGGDTSRTVTDVALSGSAVLLTVDPAVEHGETGIRVSYTVPTGTASIPLQDVLGNDADRLSNVPVTNETPDTTSPTVSKLEITSDPGTDRTYAAGDEIRVTVTFSEPVDVERTPRLMLKVGDRNRPAGYLEGTGTTELVFGYEVADGDEDTDGVSIEANRLTLNGGTIRDGSNNNAVLDHDGLAANSGHKVDGAGPDLAETGGAVVNGTTLTLTYDEALDGGSRPVSGDFTVSEGDRVRAVTGVRVNGSGVELTLDVGAEHGEAGILVSYTVPTGMGANPIRDMPGNDAEALSRESVTNETPDTTSPEVSILAISSNPGSDQTYAAGDEIEVTVTFSETVEVEGTPQLRLRVGTRTRTAGYETGTGTASLVFAYEVADGDDDTGGVSIEAGRIAVNGGAIEDEADNDAVLDHQTVAPQAGHKVDGVRPAFVSAAVDGSSLTLACGEALDEGSRPAPGDFTVEVDGAGRSVSGVSVNGSVVTLTLNPAVERGDTGIRVSYAPDTNPIRDAVGNDALALSNRPVTNATGAPNTAPRITSTGPFTVRENQATVRRLAARDTDPGDEVTGWAIVGGADQGQFAITSDTGDLSFRTAPDFEAPGDNEYEVRVEVRSGAGARELEAEQTFTLRVTDEREPPDVPEAPTFSGATADSLQASWSEPDNTGPAITDYDVQYREKGTGRFTDGGHEGPGLSLTLSDLKAGTLYEVQVRATNDEGTSDWSESGEGMTIAPLTVQMMSDIEPPVEGPFMVRFSFSETVTGFSPNDIETDQDPACMDDPNTPVFCDPVIGGLETIDDRIFTASVTPGTGRVAHNYMLSLTVPAGRVSSLTGNKPNEEATLEVRVAPPGVTVPISSLDLTASAGNAEVRLSWRRPANTGGSPIIRYEYRHAAVGEEWGDWENVVTGARGVTVGNLVNDQEYVFEARAVNALGKGPAETAMETPVRSTGNGGGGGGGGGGGTPTRPTVNTDPLITTPGPFDVAENQMRVVRIEAIDADPGDAIRSYAIAGGADADRFSIVAHTGVLSFREPPNFEAPADVGSTDPPSEAGDNEYIVVVRVASGPVSRDRTVEQAFTVRVTDADRESPGAPDRPRLTLALEVSLTVEWAEPENPGPPITDYDVQYREGPSGFFINVPHEGPDRATTLTGLKAATLYQVQVRARNEEGTGRWSEPGEGMTLAGPPAVLPFSVPDRGGISITSQGTSPELRVGYGQVETDAGMTPPAGLAIFASRLNGILVSEAGVPASAAVLEGRIFAETDGPVRTGLALANPNDTAATIAFFFTDSNGIDSGHDTFTLGPRKQMARFLDEEPFNGGSAMFGTFTFTADLPVAVIALRGFVNERSEFLMTTLPVAPLAVPTTGTVYFPHFAAGGGWTTQVILVNPTHALISGNVQFISSGSETEAAAPATLTLADGRSGSTFSYAIPPRSATRLRTSNPAGPLQVGSVRAVPDPGQPAPSGVSIFAFQKDGMTVSEAGVPASTSGAAFRVYVEASGTPGQPHAVRSGIALTNTSDAPTTVSLELTDLDGTATGLPESLTIPASGHVARFIDEFFPALTTPFSGILRIASTAPDIAAVGLRLAINPRDDILVTTTPPADENAALTASDLFFPHFVDSGGWTTQFILFSGSTGQTASGVIRFTGQDGQPLELSVAPTAAPTIP